MDAETAATNLEAIKQTLEIEGQNALPSVIEHIQYMIQQIRGKK